ncbi:hypothetical protein Fuma_01629 [Fuerstiella marisgermanici]|uniref:Uncharacterized protein n=1 Tax=Fuerstiella marisgermanici TaxID=1891926 RepID=A0A1P8WD71_9PLAN|nr:hypothetical protein Fuma_01629 [Fuerstiella marisgermanici]
MVSPSNYMNQVRDEGNCGEEACECAVKLTLNSRRQPHSRQSCEPPLVIEILRTEIGYKAGTDR